MKLQKVDTSIVKATTHEHPVFIDPDTIPWTPWVIEGTSFKLMHLKEDTGGFTMFLKVEAGNDAPIHGHIGSSEVYIMEGEFGYDDDRGAKGHYGYEPAGASHMPTSPGGTIMFAIIHGPLFGYNPDGSIGGIVDGQAMYAMAKENNAHKHLHLE